MVEANDSVCTTLLVTWHYTLISIQSADTHFIGFMQSKKTGLTIVPPSPPLGPGGEGWGRGYAILKLSKLTKTIYAILSNLVSSVSYHLFLKH